MSNWGDENFLQIYVRRHTPELVRLAERVAARGLSINTIRFMSGNRSRDQASITASTALTDWGSSHWVSVTCVTVRCAGDVPQGGTRTIQHLAGWDPTSIRLDWRAEFKGQTVSMIAHPRYSKLMAFRKANGLTGFESKSVH